MGNRDNFGKCRSCGQQVIWIKTVAGKNMPCNPQLVTYRQGDGKEKIVTPNGEVLSGCRKAQKEITESRYFL